MDCVRVSCVHICTNCAHWSAGIFVILQPRQGSGDYCTHDSFHLFISVACFLHRMLPYLTFFLHFFTCISFSLRINPLHFHAVGRKRQPNLGFVSLFDTTALILLYCAATTFCCENISRRHTCFVRRVNAAMPRSRTLSVPTSTTRHTGLRSTVPASADSSRDRCDRLTSTWISAAVKVSLLQQETLAATGEAISEVCCLPGNTGNRCIYMPCTRYISEKLLNAFA